MKFIDDMLNKTSMYGLTLYGLISLAFISTIFSLLGLITISWLSLVITLLLLIAVCGLVNYLFSLVLKIPLNQESSHISALILFFVLNPVSDLRSFYVAILAATLAMTSKYVLNICGKHIFNPAAISVFILDLVGIHAAIWWVSSPILILPIIILGFLILRKIKRLGLFTSFAITSLLTIFLFQFRDFSQGLLDLEQAIIWGPLVFFGTIMLTEPFTLPPTTVKRSIYGVLVGFLFGLPYHLGPLFSSPETALIVGNIFSYLVSFKSKIKLFLVRKEQISDHLYDLVFRPERSFAYQAGQYMEWTMSNVSFNLKGNRRYFTLASSPTEKDIRLGISYHPDYPSAFKEKMLSMKEGESLVADNLAGDFVLPRNPKEKMVFIAGGIGVTPFRSMIKYLIDKKEQRDIIIFYSVTKNADLAYQDVIQEAQTNVGIKFIRVITDEKIQDEIPSKITVDLIKREIPDYKERIFYLSGPPGMVKNFQSLLVKLGVKKIKTDFFTGY